MNKSDNNGKKDFIREENLPVDGVAGGGIKKHLPFIVTLCLLAAVLIGCVVYGTVKDNLNGVMQTVGSIAVALLVLLVMITVHELGHYVTGKIFGFGITEFALGFGPAIFKRKRKNGEYFSIRAIPLGGFCAFEGEDDESTSPTAFNNRKPWQRIIVLVAGATMNFLLALVLIAMLFGIYGQGMFTPIEMLPTTQYSQSLEASDAIVKLNGKTIYLQTDMIDALEGMKEGDEVEAVVYRDGRFENITITLRADVTSENATDLSGVTGALGTANLMYIDEVEEGSPFIEGEAIFRERSYDYENDVDNADGQYLKEQRIFSAGELFGYLSTFEEGETAKLWTYREEGYHALDIVIPEGFDEATEQNFLSLLGVKSVIYQERWTTTNVRLGFWQTLGGTFVYAFRISGTIFTVLGELLSCKLGMDAMGGTVTTVLMTSQAIRFGGFKFLLDIAAYIGVNLAVFNLLPIPALDGSRVIFTAIEWITRKPVNKKVEGIIHTVGLVLLFGFAIMVDFLHLFA